MIVAALEKHYRVKDLASLWGFSDNTIIKLFSNEPGVICLESITGKRKYATLSIPESVALRVHERLGNEAVASRLEPFHSLRVIRLSNIDAGMRKKPRQVLRVKSAAEDHSGRTKDLG